MRSAWNTGGRIDDQMKLRCLSDNPWGDGTEYLREENAELKAENERLKTELEKYDWKTGEPEVAGEYLVYVKNSEGDCRYLTSDYVINNYVGNWFDAELYDLDVLAYSEIRPFEKEGE